MVPAVLAALGRSHDPARVKSAVEAAAEAGFAHTYSVDLIFGAAGESRADWETSLARVLDLDPRPAHVSAYALTVEAGTPLWPRRGPPPGPRRSGGQVHDGRRVPLVGGVGVVRDIQLGSPGGAVAGTTASTGPRGSTSASVAPLTRTGSTPRAASLDGGGTSARPSVTSVRRAPRRIQWRGWKSSTGPHGARNRPSS